MIRSEHATPTPRPNPVAFSLSAVAVFGLAALQHERCGRRVLNDVPCYSLITELNAQCNYRDVQTSTGHHDSNEAIQSCT